MENNTTKQTHRPGELPGQKASPVSQNKKPILEIRSLTKNFSNFTAVNNVDLTIYEGEIFALLGSSGCGKSTLLRMLAGFENPSAGHIILDGKDIVNLPPYKRTLNMMFQSYALFPYMTVKQNIAFGLKQEHLPKDVINERVEKMLKLVHMEDYVDRKPFQLSGGQRQRVALARSLAKEPRLLLLDEPMGALDKKLREQMRLELVDIINSVGVTCLMVTHDQEEAMTMADRIAIMDRGEFVQIGGPREIYENPNCRFSAEFIGSVNMFDCTLVSSDIHCSIIKCDDFKRPIELKHDIDIADGMPLSIAMRPEKIYISREQPEEESNWCTGTVENIAYLGDISIYYVRLPSGRIVTSTLPNVDRFNVGLPTWDDQVFLSWDPESCIALTF
ncbi:MAG: polyamine ABC transporter ATP-binding protein [Succinivibrio sp.]|jgi:putrescine transport system ATP-binding protein|nr:polyamine ABC transporter ATP-binding protein [Succinivibrio sp.]